MYAILRGDGIAKTRKMKAEKGKTIWYTEQATCYILQKAGINLIVDIFQDETKVK